MPSLLPVTHRSPDQVEGPSACWRAFCRDRPEHGWEIDVRSAHERANAGQTGGVARVHESTNGFVLARLAP